MRHVHATGGVCRACQPVAFGRRGFFAGAGALALARPGQAQQGQAQEKLRAIDVHHHISPPTWLAAVKKAGLDNPPMNNWTPQHSLEQMDAAGVQTSITSPTTPQATFLPPADSAAVSRDANEYAARLRADHPGRFGMFAMLPLPHIDESLAEITHALDVLHADGIGVMTSYGNNWLGYEQFAPVWEELNRRRAVVYTHPTGAPCCVNLVHGIADSALEYGTDTTRTITNLIFTGMSRRYPDITWIFSHGGGVLTAVAERLEIQMPGGPPYKGKIDRAIVDGELRRFFYDTAQIANAVTVEALVKLVPVSQVVFGSDYPYRTVMEHVTGLEARFGSADLQAIARNNALRWAPQLAA